MEVTERDAATSGFTAINVHPLSMVQQAQYPSELREADLVRRESAHSQPDALARTSGGSQQMEHMQTSRCLTHRHSALNVDHERDFDSAPAVSCAMCTQAEASREQDDNRDPEVVNQQNAPEDRLSTQQGIRENAGLDITGSALQKVAGVRKRVCGRSQHEMPDHAS